MRVRSLWIGLILWDVLGGAVVACGAESRTVTRCQPRTCDEAEWVCGEMGDGCGQTVNCGSCELGQVCLGGACFAACNIDGDLWPAAATNPNNACELCLPEATTTAWSASPEGTTCGTASICAAGQCLSQCRVNGMAYAPDAPDPANNCASCQPQVSATQFSELADGTPCAPSKVCVSGACESYCFIDGVLYSAGAPNPQGPCQTCAPSQSASTFTDVADGTGCGAALVCNLGACESACFVDGVTYPAGAADPANVCQSCQPAISTTSFSPLGDGSACAAGQICVSGACAAYCAIGGQIYSPDAIHPNNACESCQPSASTSSWQARANGTPCDNGVCAAGACASWRWQRPLPQGNVLWSLWQSESGFLVVVGLSGTVLTSADSGATWQVKESGTTKALRDVWGTGTGVLFAVGDEATLLRSTDNGDNWTTLMTGFPGRFEAVAGPPEGGLIDPSNHVVAAGSAGVVLSWNLGDTWELPVDGVSGLPFVGMFEDITVNLLGETVVVGSDAVSGNRIVLVSPDAFYWEANTTLGAGGLRGAWADENGVFYITGSSGSIFTSADGGFNWSPLPSGVAYALGDIWGSSSANIYVLAATGSTAIRSSDAGASWTPNAIGISSLFAIEGRSTGEAFAVGPTLVAHTPDATPSWSAVMSHGAISFEAAWGPSEGTLYVVGGPAAEIFTSADRGATWTQVNGVVGGGLKAIWGSGPGDIYAVGNSGTLLHSTDGGATWPAESISTTYALVIVWGRNANEVYVAGRSAGASGVWTSSDQGDTWTPLTLPAFPSLSLYAVAGRGSSDLYVAGGGTLPGNTFTSAIFAHSPDNGANWNVSSTTSSLGAFRSLWLAGTGEIFAAGDGGDIAVSSDHGANWTALQSGSTSSFTAIWGNNAGELYAGGFGQAIFHSPDLGSTWRPVFALTPTIYGIWGSAPNNIYAVGGGETIVSFRD